VLSCGLGYTNGRVCIESQRGNSPPVTHYNGRRHGFMLRPEVAVYLSPTVAWVVTGQATYMGAVSGRALYDDQWVSNPEKALAWANCLSHLSIYSGFHIHMPALN